MSTVSPPPPPPPPVAQTMAQPSAVVSNPPASLTSVAVGTRIDAIIVATTPDGRVEVESRLGRFLIQPNVSLPKEGTIQLQVQVLARQIFLAITSIHGKQPFAALRKLGLTPPPASLTGKMVEGTAPKLGPFPSAIGALQSTNAKAGVITTGSTLTATLLKPTGLSIPTVNNAQPKMEATHNIAPEGQKSSISGAKAAAAYGTPMSNGLSQASTSLTPSGMTFTVKVLEIKLPNMGANSLASNEPPFTSMSTSGSRLLPGQSLNGVVFSNPNQNATLIHTQVGPIALNVPQNLPSGAAVGLQILAELSSLNDEVHNQLATTRLSRFLLQSRSWPALNQAVDLLREINPQTAFHLINTAIPKPDNALAANIMRFILGVRSGELTNFIADNSLRLLMQDRPNLVRRLREDFRVIGRMSEEPTFGDWRAVPVPIANGHEIQQIQLLMQRIPFGEEDEEARTGPGTRFVVDVELSQMGQIQLDGLVHEAGKNFDLVIRSDKQLREPIQNQIRIIFEDCQKLTGTSGWLRFQSAPPEFVDIFKGNSNGQLGLVV